MAAKKKTTAVTATPAKVHPPHKIELANKIKQREEQPTTVIVVDSTQGILEYTDDSGQKYLHTMPAQLAQKQNFKQYKNGTALRARWFKGNEDDYSDSMFFGFQVDTEAIKNMRESQVIVWGNKMVVPKEVKRGFDIASEMAKKFGYSCTSLTGPTGMGKTEMFLAYAREIGVPAVVVDCTTLVESTDLYGRVGLKGSETYIEFSEFAKMLIQGNCMIMFDEINRAAPSITNPLLAVTDDRGVVEPIPGVIIERGKNIMFFSTKNQGYAYTGTHEQDAALERRFNVAIPMRRLTIAEEVKAIALNSFVTEDIANRIVSLATQLRKMFDLSSSDKFDSSSDNKVLGIEFTTAYSVALAKVMSVGVNMRTAMEFVFIGKLLEPSDKKNVIDEINKIADCGKLDW